MSRIHLERTAGPDSRKGINRMSRSLLRMCPRNVSGVTFVEVMFASLILVVGLMAMMNVWLFSMQLTRTTDETAVGYSLGRETLEDARKAGYLLTAITPTGPTQTYYNSD